MTKTTKQFTDAELIAQVLADHEWDCHEDGDQKVCPECKADAVIHEQWRQDLRDGEAAWWRSSSTGKHYL